MIKNSECTSYTKCLGDVTNLTDVDLMASRSELSPLILAAIFLPQDEYSIFPQTYSIDINGYILVYSVTSIKR